MKKHQRGTEDPIRESLRRLPRIGASPGFSRQVLARATETEKRDLRPRQWPRLAAAATLLAVAAGVFLLTRQDSHQRDYELRRAALEQRHEALRRELAEVRELASRSPQLYLGSASDVDLVLDLEPWMASEPTVQPASYRTQP